MKIKDLKPKVKEFAYQRMREQTPKSHQREFNDDNSLGSFFQWNLNGQEEREAWLMIFECNGYKPMYKLYPHLREE